MRSDSRVYQGSSSEKRPWSCTRPDGNKSADALVSSRSVGDARCDSGELRGSSSAVNSWNCMGPYDNKSAETLLSKRRLRGILRNSTSPNENGSANAHMGSAADVRKD